jgi:SAM-dependent methyltransferase
MLAEDFAANTFQVPAGRSRRLTEVVLRYVDPHRSLRVLDIGCGTGGFLLELAAVLPHARLTGVDVSRPNIEAARRQCRRLPFASRLSFEHADYLKYRAEPFDVITASSTLHLIPAPTSILFAKIAADLASGGLLVNSMPCRCLYNRLLMGVRRVFRAVRCRWTDALVARTGRLLYGKKLSPEFVRERVHYMYVIPGCYDGSRLDVLLSGCGLQRLETFAEPHASLAQPKHTLAVFRKQAASRHAAGLGRPAA